ncbi:hypothetical protein PTKU46_75000 [Paraburkholderia terrae]|uniref:flagellar biosynthetic protein FliO n=1 Tax=Paraburkholderia terrae TaxID=311230 RepID=UPI0030E275F7
MTHTDPGLFRVSLALSLCLVIGFAVILALRRFGASGVASGTRAEKRLKVVETARLGTKATLHLIECDGASLLLACDENGIRTLHTVCGGQLEHTQ